MIKDITTIKLSKKTVDALHRLKIHPRQSYEEVVLKLIYKHQRKKFDFSGLEFSKEQITTIKLHKDTVELLNKLKIHPRQSYEEVVLKLVQNEKIRKSAR
jgi:hypothetical protein